MKGFNEEDIPEGHEIAKGRSGNYSSWRCFYDPANPFAVYLETNFIETDYAYRFQIHRDKIFSDVFLLTISEIYLRREATDRTMVADPSGSKENAKSFAIKKIVEMLGTYFDMEGVETKMRKALI